LRINRRALVALAVTGAFAFALATNLTAATVAGAATASTTTATTPTSSTPTSSITSPTSTTSTTSTVFYLDLGASMSVGVQPTPTVPNGQPTDHGYANALVALEAAKGVTLELTQLGCPGESLMTMINGGDRCYPLPDTQLADAVAFLQAHLHEDGLVTIDLGFNTLHPCFKQLTIDRACVGAKLDLIQQQLVQILTTLKSAAGPNVTFVGVGHYNPFLADYLLGQKGRTFAADTNRAMRSFNRVLRDTYHSFAMPIAPVARAFSGDDSRIVEMPDVGLVPANVAQSCALTWMCQPSPFGPNLHPNDAGSRAIADAIATVLPATL
jgi:lysophospholipase L1-like esterase